MRIKVTVPIVDYPPIELLVVDSYEDSEAGGDVEMTVAGQTVALDQVEVALLIDALHRVQVD